MLFLNWIADLIDLPVSIGSRKAMEKISSDFKDVWITFIRAFNRLKKEKEDAKIRALTSQAEILSKLISKRNQSISAGSSDKEVDKEISKALTGLWTILDSVHKLLQKMGEDFPKMSPQELFLRKKILKEKIRNAKADIVFCADVLEEYENTKEMTPEQLSRRQFFKKAGRITTGALAVMLAGSTGLTAGIYTALLGMSKDLPLKKEDGLAILISYGTTSWWDAALKPFSKLFVPAYVARVEIAFGQKANVVKTAATSTDLFEVLEDRKIQNIVIFGHGRWWSWEATDGAVSIKDLKKRYDPKYQKKGILVRHTCGHDREENLSALSANCPKEEIEALETEARKAETEIRKIRGMREFSVSYKVVKKNASGMAESCGLLIVEHAFPNSRPQKLIITNPLTAVISREIYFSSWLKTFGSDKEVKQVHPEMMGVKNTIDRFWKHLFLFVERNTIWSKTERTPFGTPYYPPERIKGWDRIAYPWEYMIDVFGDKKLDLLYAKKEAHSSKGESKEPY